LGVKFFFVFVFIVFFRMPNFEVKAQDSKDWMFCRKLLIAGLRDKIAELDETVIRLGDDIKVRQELFQKEVWDLVVGAALEKERIIDRLMAEQAKREGERTDLMIRLRALTHERN